MGARNQATPVPVDAGTPEVVEPTPEQEPPHPPPSDDVPEVDPTSTPEHEALRNVRAALADMAEDRPSAVTPEPEGTPDPDPPVYDERGNVRPRGTPGARYMTKAERTKIAHALARGESIVTTAEKPRKG